MFHTPSLRSAKVEGAPRGFNWLFYGSNTHWPARFQLGPRSLVFTTRDAPKGKVMLSEFKAFIAKGNVLDLAVAVIIGAAFATITKSLTDDIIMPIVGAIFGGLDFANYFVVLGPIPDTFKGDPASYADLKEAGVAVLGWGQFVTVLINFLILAFVIFLLVRAANKSMKKARGSARRSERSRTADRDPGRAPEALKRSLEPDQHLRNLLGARADVPVHLPPALGRDGPSSLLLVRISPSVVIVNRPSARDGGPSLPLSGRPIILARAPNGPVPPVSAGAVTMHRSVGCAGDSMMNGISMSLSGIIGKAKSWVSRPSK